MKLKDIANDYLESLQLRGRSEETIKKYRSILNKFIGEDSENLKDITHSHMHDWFVSTHQDKKTTTKRFTLSVLSNFFRYCREEGLINKNPINKIRIPPMPDSLPKILDENELAKVKTEADKLPIRDRAIIEFLFSSGCRGSELCSLNIENVDIENRTAKVFGRRGVYRIIIFSMECAQLLTEYLNSRTDKEPALFISKRGTRLSIYSIRKILLELGRKVELQYNLSPIHCRYTLATQLLSKDAHLAFIASQLGHRNIHTTLNYARVLRKEQNDLCKYKKMIERVLTL